MIARTLVNDAERRLEAELAGRPLPPLIVAIGLGSGELLDVLDRRGAQTRVLALEPDAAVGRAFLARGQWASWRTSGRLAYYVGPDFDGADEAWRLFPPEPDDHLLLVEPAVAAAASEGAVRAARLIKRLVFGARANAEARRRFAPRYLTNALRNLPALAAGRDVRDLEGTYRGSPAVIAAAGPSLDGVLEELGTLHGRSLLIAVDTALRPLLDYGIEPTLVVGMDPGAMNARHFGALPRCGHTWLVAETALDPEAVRGFGGRTFWFRVSNHHPWPWFRSLGIDVGQLDVWGSVLTAAFQVAWLAGCDPIVLVGADLAHSGGRPYARGTTYEFDWAYAAATGADLSRAWELQRASYEPLTARDLAGGETITTRPLQAFRDWVVRRATQSGRRIVNATGRGILHGRGIQLSAIRDVVACDTDVPQLSSVLPERHDPVSAAPLASRLRDVRARLGEASLAPIADWIEFSGSGYHPADVAEALDGAARALDGVSPAARPRASLEVACVEPASGGTILRQLPEAVTRLREALNGAAVLPALEGRWATAEGASAALMAARELLVPLVDVLRDGLEDASVAARPATVGRGPVSGTCEWPDDIAWLLQRFEALLGCAAWPASEAETDSFVSRPVRLRDLGSGDPAGPSATPTIAHLACFRAVFEWLWCASAQRGLPPSDRARVGCILRAVETEAGAEGTGSSVQADGVDLGGILQLVSTAHHDLPSLDLPTLRVDRRPLARALTGMVAVPSSGPHRPSVFTAPRVLTDEGLRRCIVAYPHREGAVCVSPHQTTSIVVREDGSSRDHNTWPHPIIGELPCGEGGAVAWNHAARGGGYVMRGFGPGRPVVVETVPFQPTFGAWWCGRFYWTCFPAGLGSWAPGQAAEFHPDLTLRSILAEPAGLLLEPIVRGGDRVPLRRLAQHAWRWVPDKGPSSEPVGSHGVVGCRSTGNGWTATGHPETDIVMLECADGRKATLTCYYPLSVAWIGRSLLVSTIGHEVLLFEGLADTLAGIFA